MKKLRLSIKTKVEEISHKERPAFESFDMEDYWVGLGFVGQKKKPEIRRFLRVRNKLGICRYFFWTEPKRGKMTPVVFSFRKRVKITREIAKKHYKKLRI